MFHIENRYTKPKIISSLFWKVLERVGVNGAQFVVQIVLARILLPHYFGTIAIISVFISFANIFVQSGFNMALVQKKDADEKDFSSVLFLSLVIAALVYVVMFLASPYIAYFFLDSQLELILKVLSLTLFIGAFNSIQNAYVSRKMLFKKLFFSSLCAVILSGSLGITVALYGAGIWSLVILQLSNQLAISIILWFTVKWRPVKEFSLGRIRTLLSFGWRIFATNVLYTLFQDLRTLIIGKLHNHSMLGFYNRGESFPQLIVSNIDGSIQSVMFPTFSSHQEDIKTLKHMVRRSVTTSSFIIFPAMIGLAVIAEPLVTVLLTEKWLPAVPFIQIFCFTYVIRPVQGINLQVINAMGRSDITLRIFMIKRAFELVVLLISIPFGIYAMAFGTFISAIFSMVVNVGPNKKLLSYSLKEQVIDLAPAFGISLAMGVIVYTVKFLNFQPLTLMVLQIFVGTISYLILAKVFKLDSLRYIMATIKGFSQTN